MITKLWTMFQEWLLSKGSSAPPPVTFVTDEGIQTAIDELMVLFAGEVR